MRTVFLVMDSLNRHYLNAYGTSWIQTPNLDRLAQRSLIFDNHYCCSMPCMPARRDMFTGRINFLETPWSPLMPWDDCLQPELRRQKETYSHMITDHYHYFHSGGECYHTRFDSWEFQRGQESDVWYPLVDPPPPPPPSRQKLPPLLGQPRIHRLRDRRGLSHPAVLSARRRIPRKQPRSRQLAPARRSLRPARAFRLPDQIPRAVRRHLGSRPL